MQGTYVAGDLAGLLHTYLDAECLAAPVIRKVLATYPANSQMPMTMWWDLLEQIQAIQQQPALGLRIGRYVRPHHSGVLGYLIMYCHTLGEALMQFQRYQRLLHNFSEVNLEVKGGGLTMSWGIEQGLSTQLSDEVFLSGLVTFVREITGQQDICPLSIDFAHPVNYDHSAYETLMGCPINFDCERVAIEIPMAALALPINSHDPHLLSLVERQAQAFMGQTQQTDPFLELVQQTLVEQLSQGALSLSLVAKQLNVSTRTLHRRMEDRGLNFKQFLQDTRKRLATVYLDDETLSLNEISFLLGYSEQSAFTRAFKQWFGTTPKRYQREHQTT